MASGFAESKRATLSRVYTKGVAKANDMLKNGVCVWKALRRAGSYVYVRTRPVELTIAIDGKGWILHPPARRVRE